MNTILDSAAAYVESGTTPRRCAELLARFLLTRFTYTTAEETPDMPAYDLLSSGRAHSLSFASVFYAECTRAGLACRLVSGTRGGETHWWNLLQLEETWYAVDLMRSVEQGGDSLDLLDPAALRDEGYDWDAEAYPPIPCRSRRSRRSHSVKNFDLLQKDLTNRADPAIMIPANAGVAHLVERHPCQGGGSEFEPRHPLRIENRCHLTTVSLRSAESSNRSPAGLGRSNHWRGSSMPLDLTGSNLFFVLALFGAGLFCIMKGGDLFVDAATWIAESTGIPKFIIGATVVSFATTMPELLVSLFSAFEGNADIAVGNAVGSVTANTGLILCISLVCMQCAMTRRQYAGKACLLLSAIGLLFVFTRDGSLRNGRARPFWPYSSSTWPKV